jgi:sulfur relay (sulfurtransferase) DsrF/TusC family protein
MMVDKLVKELNMKPDEIYKMNYIDCLNWLSLFNDKERWIAQQQKKQIDELKMNMKR